MTMLDSVVSLLVSRPAKSARAEDTAQETRLQAPEAKRSADANTGFQALVDTGAKSDISSDTAALPFAATSPAKPLISARHGDGDALSRKPEKAGTDTAPAPADTGAKTEFLARQEIARQPIAGETEPQTLAVSPADETHMRAAPSQQPDIQTDTPAKYNAELNTELNAQLNARAQSAKAATDGTQKSWPSAEIQAGHYRLSAQGGPRTEGPIKVVSVRSHTTDNHGAVPQADPSGQPLADARAPESDAPTPSATAPPGEMVATKPDSAADRQTLAAEASGRAEASQGILGPGASASSPANMAATPPTPFTPIAPNGTPQLIVASPSEVPQIVAQTLAQNETTDRISIQLDPPELGRVSIEFQMDDSGVHTVTITGETSEALRKLRLMNFELLQALEQQGLGGRGFSLEYQHSDRSRDWAQAAAQTDTPSDESEVPADPAWSQSLPLATRLADPAKLEPGGLNLRL